MSHLVVGTDFWNHLVPEAGAVECRGEDGQLLGVVLSAERYKRIMLAAAPFSDEEIAAARRESPGSSTKDVLARLNALTKPATERRRSSP